MVEKIIDQIISWTAENIIVGFDELSKSVLEGISPDLTVMLKYFPFLQKTSTIFVWTGISLVILMLIMSLLRVFAGPTLDNQDTPFPILARALLFLFMVPFMYQICGYAIKIAKIPYDAMWNMDNNYEYTFQGLLNANLSHFEHLGIHILSMIVSLFVVIAIFINYIRLLLEAIERYVLIGVLTIMSPLAAAMGSSRSTGGVFRSWVRMYGSGLFLLTINVLFLRAFSSSMPIGMLQYGAIEIGADEYTGSFILWMLAVLALLKIGQRMDSYFAALGLSTAQTGGGLYMEMMAAGRMVTGAASKIVESSRHGRSSGGSGRAGSAGAMVNAPVYQAGKHAVDGNNAPHKNTGETTTYSAKNVAGTKYEATHTDLATGGKTSVGRVNLSTERTPNAPYYKQTDENGVAWAHYASGKNASAYLGPQFGEYSANTQFQMVQNPTKDGQMKAADVAETYRNQYLQAVGDGLTGSRAHDAANSATRDAVRTNTFNESRASGTSIEEATRAGERAAAGYDMYQDERNKLFGPHDLPHGAMIDTDTGEVGHMRVHGSNEYGETVEQDLYLASAYDTPQGMHQVITDNQGNDWYAISNANYNEGMMGANSHAYLAESYIPDLEEQVGGNVTAMYDGEKADTGILRFNVGNDQYQLTDASRYRQPTGDFKVVSSTNGPQYYMAQGEETIKTVPVRHNGGIVTDEKGSIQTEKVLAYKHQKPMQVNPPSLKH